MEENQIPKKSSGKLLVSVIVIIVVLVASFFVYNSMKSSNQTSKSGSLNNLPQIGDNSTQTANGSSSSGSTKVINIQASRWQYSPNTITVKKGDHVKIVIDNTDTAHGIVIPGLGVSGMDSVEFTANNAGTFEFKCPTFCGEGHRDMTGTLIVQ